MAGDKIFNILSLDGGGVRGVLSARLLERIDRKNPGFIDSFDLIAGTSTGSILAAALSLDFEAEQLVELYRGGSRSVFNDNIFENIRDLGRVRGANYNVRGIRRMLRSKFGDAKLGDADRYLLIPTFNLDNGHKNELKRTWKPKFFHNFPGKDSDKNEKVVDVVLRSCASPTFFPSYQGYIDGAVVANNPCMAAVAQVLKSKKADLDGIRVMSIGTGFNPEFVRGKTLNWGLLQWAPLLPRLLTAGSMGVAEYQCEQLLGSRFHRITKVLEDRIPMDAVGRVDELIEIADGINLSGTMRWLKKFGIVPR